LEFWICKATCSASSPAFSTSEKLIHSSSLQIFVSSLLITF
jgi:hypothetical protein